MAGWCEQPGQPRKRMMTRLAGPVRGTAGRSGAGGGMMDENEHPKGALLFMLIYLLLLAGLWLNAYLRLWGG